MMPSERPETTSKTPKAEPVAIVHARRKCLPGQKYTPQEIATKKEIICLLFTAGETTFARAAKVAGINRNTLLLWRKDDEAFDQAINDARTVAIEILETEAFICAKKAVADARYQTALFKVLEARHPAYRRVRHEGGTNENLSIAMQIHGMSEEELERMTPIVPPIPAWPGE